VVCHGDTTGTKGHCTLPLCPGTYSCC
jgi:hypothetical protein